MALWLLERNDDAGTAECYAAVIRAATEEDAREIARTQLRTHPHSLAPWMGKEWQRDEDVKCTTIERDGPSGVVLAAYQGV